MKTRNMRTIDRRRVRAREDKLLAELPKRAMEIHAEMRAKGIQPRQPPYGPDALPTESALAQRTRVLMLALNVGDVLGGRGP